MKNSKEMTYQGSGVDYDAMDPFKRAAQVLAAQTSKNAAPRDRAGAVYGNAGVSEVRLLVFGWLVAGFGSIS